MAWRGGVLPSKTALLLGPLNVTKTPTLRVSADLLEQMARRDFNQRSETGKPACGCVRGGGQRSGSREEAPLLEHRQNIIVSALQHHVPGIRACVGPAQEEGQAPRGGRAASQTALVGDPQFSLPLAFCSSTHCVPCVSQCDTTWVLIDLYRQVPNGAPPGHFLDIFN